MSRKFLSLLAIVSLLASSVSAQQPVVELAPDAARLRAHVTYLASEKLEGRRTGTPGASDAASYVAAEFGRLGLKSLTGSGIFSMEKRRVGGKEILACIHYPAYLQRFPFVVRVELGKANKLKMKSRGGDGARVTVEPRVGEEWMPLGFGANAKVEDSPVVFVGYGITAAEQTYDDYKDAGASGKVALALAGTPDGDNPHGRFTRAGELRFKAAAAHAAGARALVLIAAEENFKDDKLARLGYDNAGGDAGLPVVVVSRQTAVKAFGAPILDAKRKALLTGASLSLSTDVSRLDGDTSNVVGVLEGSDPKLKDEYVVVGAHYDHLGRGGQGSLAAREGEIHYGADDNASGTAAMLELARLFSESATKPRRSVVFVAFGGEEGGLIGSSFYAKNPVVPLEQTIAMINMDMVGRLRDDKLFVGGVGTSTEWRKLIAGANESLDIKVVAAGASEGQGKRVEVADNNAPGTGGMAVVYGANGQVVATAKPKQRFALTLDEDGFGPSDHSSFYAKKIPVLFFFTGTHDDYHKPSDTADRVNYEGEARVVSFVHDIVRAVDASDARPTYAVARGDNQMGRSTGFKVSLGTIPSYAESSDGVKLNAVRDDSPAAKAGLKPGDRIVKMAGREIRNVYDYTYALAEMKAGQEYEVEIVRDDERKSLKITPAARK